MAKRSKLLQKKPKARKSKPLETSTPSYVNWWRAKERLISWNFNVKRNNSKSIRLISSIKSKTNAGSWNDRLNQALPIKTCRKINKN